MNLILDRWFKSFQSCCGQCSRYLPFHHRAFLTACTRPTSPTRPVKSQRDTLSLCLLQFRCPQKSWKKNPKSFLLFLLPDYLQVFSCLQLIIFPPAWCDAFNFWSLWFYFHIIFLIFMVNESNSSAGVGEFNFDTSTFSLDLYGKISSQSQIHISGRVDFWLCINWMHFFE